jgi:hypothetical protein
MQDAQRFWSISRTTPKASDRSASQQGTPSTPTSSAETWDLTWNGTVPQFTASAPNYLQHPVSKELEKWSPASSSTGTASRATTSTLQVSLHLPTKCSALPRERRMDNRQLRRRRQCKRRAEEDRARLPGRWYGVARTKHSVRQTIERIGGVQDAKLERRTGALTRVRGGDCGQGISRSPTLRQTRLRMFFMTSSTTPSQVTVTNCSRLHSATLSTVLSKSSPSTNLSP